MSVRLPGPERRDSILNAAQRLFFEPKPAEMLFDLEADPHESHNLAENPEHASTLARLQARLKEFQTRTADPWILKWRYE